MEKKTILNLVGVCPQLDIKKLHFFYLLYLSSELKYNLMHHLKL